MAESGSAGAAAAAEGAGSAASAAEGDASPAGAAGFTPPSEWSEVEHYKPFFKEDKSFDVDGLAKAYADTIVKVPVIPAKAEDYTFEFPKDSNVDQAALKVFQQTVHELGLTQAQYEGLAKHDLAMLAQRAEAENKELAASSKKLAAEWGGKQIVDSRMVQCKSVAKALFGDEKLAEYPDMARGLWKIASMVSEDKLKLGSGAGAAPPTGLDGRPLLRGPSWDSMPRNQ